MQMTDKDEYADLSHRMLTVTAWNTGVFFISFSFVYRILHSANQMTMRGIQKRHDGRTIPTVHKKLNAPNQRWC